jgi:hypothetical protein
MVPASKSALASKSVTHMEGFSKHQLTSRLLTYFRLLIAEYEAFLSVHVY